MKTKSPSPKPRPYDSIPVEYPTGKRLRAAARRDRRTVARFATIVIERGMAASQLP